MRGNIERLPKWAQQRIALLERNLADAKARLAVGPEDSDTFANPYTDAPRPLGKGTPIDFRAGDSWGHRFTVRLEGGALQVMGGYSITVHPKASNVVEIRAESPGGGGA